MSKRCSSARTERIFHRASTALARRSRWTDEMPRLGEHRVRSDKFGPVAREPVDGFLVKRVVALEEGDQRAGVEQHASHGGRHSTCELL